MNAYTIGHGSRPMRHFLELLQAADVRTVIDVRRSPRSRRYPQYNQEQLAERLERNGILYSFRGDALGHDHQPEAAPASGTKLTTCGRSMSAVPEAQAFRRAVVELGLEIRSEAGVALLCSEALWWKCHRRIIADALTIQGIDVLHLVSEHHTEPHRMRARVSSDGWPIYGYAPSKLPVAV